uniref:Cadherin domain-containing protein n=1 Tax=Laticauda laticaudata TaxID=8630 RepID=A0A8C5RRE1_LATLA
PGRHLGTAGQRFLLLVDYQCLRTSSGSCEAGEAREKPCADDSLVQVAENQPSGTPVITVAAQDSDSGEAGRLVYSMDALMNSRSLELFGIDSQNGLISTTEVLDRENMDLHYFRVTAVDHGIPRLSATTMVAITVADRNDHNPVFEQSEYRETIRENVEEGYPILQLRATDVDSPPNAHIRYRFVNEQAAHSVFEIDSRSGLITTSGQVDREKMEKYSLVVESNDQGKEPGPLSSTVRVYITVLDENDNVPQFSENAHYQGVISEDSPPFTSVLQISATDRDAHANGRVQYTFQNGEDGDGDFIIEPTSGIIRTIRRLDRESIPVYELTAYAVDRGMPPQRTPVHVQVSVQDINDNAPVFPASEFSQIDVIFSVLKHSLSGWEEALMDLKTCNLFLNVIFSLFPFLSPSLPPLFLSLSLSCTHTHTLRGLKYLGSMMKGFINLKTFKTFCHQRN